MVLKLTIELEGVPAGKLCMYWVQYLLGQGSHSVPDSFFSMIYRARDHIKFYVSKITFLSLIS